MSEHGSQAQDSSFDEEDDAAAEALDVMVRGQSTELCENCQSCEKCRHLEIFPVPRTPGMAQSPAEGPLGTSSLGSSTGSFPSPEVSVNSSLSSTRSRAMSEGYDGYDLDRSSTMASGLPRLSTEREQLGMHEQLKDMEANRRVVDQVVILEDLSATWDDKEIRGANAHWRSCLVSDRKWHELGAVKQNEARRLQNEEKRRAADDDGDGAVDKDVIIERLDERRDAEATPLTPRPRLGSFANDGESQRATSEGDLRPYPAFINRAGAPDEEAEEAEEDRFAVLVRDGGDEGPCSAVGGHGKVFRAVWKGSIQVAIKQPKNEGFENTAETRLFLDVHHPHLVACYGILTDKKGVKSIVTERCTVNLQAFLSKHERWQYFHDEPLTPEKIDFRKYTILEHVSQGLLKLHDMCVLHRDLKGLNILLDGDSGECDSCHHSGAWKICDFGEAKILKTPTLAFEAPKPWTDEFDNTRWVEITSETLTHPSIGAKWYCWLLPGETKATAAGMRASPYSSAEGQRQLKQELAAIGSNPRCWSVEEMSLLKEKALAEHAMSREELDGLEQPKDVIAAVLKAHNPYPFGALVYSFSSADRGGIVERDPRDCVFAVMDPVSSQSDDQTAGLSESQGDEFPKSLRPFNIIPAEELNETLLHHVHVDLQRNTYLISKPQRRRELWPDQVKCLHELYPSSEGNRGGIEGRISKPHRLPPTVMGEQVKLERRRRRIPDDATHVVFAYQLKPWTTNDLQDAEQLAVFQMCARTLRPPHT
jgi:serine/threonine protein kinase